MAPCPSLPGCDRTASSPVEPRRNGWRSPAPSISCQRPKKPSLAVTLATSTWPSWPAPPSTSAWRRSERPRPACCRRRRPWTRASSPGWPSISSTGWTPRRRWPRPTAPTSGATCTSASRWTGWFAWTDCWMPKAGPSCAPPWTPACCPAKTTTAPGPAACRRPGRALPAKDGRVRHRRWAAAPSGHPGQPGHAAGDARRPGGRTGGWRIGAGGDRPPVGLRCRPHPHHWPGRAGRRDQPRHAEHPPVHPAGGGGARSDLCGRALRSPAPVDRLPPPPALDSGRADDSAQSGLALSAPPSDGPRRGLGSPVRGAWPVGTGAACEIGRGACSVGLTNDPAGYLKTTAMLSKSAQTDSNSHLLTQYWVPCKGSLTRTWVADTPLRVTACSA